MFQFIHAADLHLDTQPGGLSDHPDEVAAVLCDASITAFGRLVDVAIERQVAFCVFAGDIYDGAERGVRAQLEFRRGLERLATAGIQSFVAHGNHDPVSEGWSAVTSWPEGVTVFDSGTPQTHLLEVNGATVAIHGVSYAEQATTDNLAVRFERSPEADFQVGVLHANVGGNADHDPYAPCSLADLTAVGLDYWALGHIHLRQTLQERRPAVVYPGNLQGRSFKPSEQGAKGAMVVSVEDGNVTAADFEAVDDLRFVAAELDISEHDDVGHLSDAIAEALDAERQTHPGRHLMVRLTLSGRGPVHRELARPAALGDLLESVRADRSGSNPVVWCASLRDRTQPQLDLDQLEASDDFVGSALSELTELVGPGGAADELLAALPDLRGLGVELPDPTDPDLVNRVRVLTADLLASERDS